MKLLASRSKEKRWQPGASRRKTSDSRSQIFPLRAAKSLVRNSLPRLEVRAARTTPKVIFMDARERLQNLGIPARGKQFERAIHKSGMSALENVTELGRTGGSRHAPGIHSHRRTAGQVLPHDRSID